jgi:hypothetical protein
MNTKIINQQLLKELNEAVAQSGEKMEGNLFYLHQQVPENYELFVPFENKRKNLAELSTRVNSIIEIGFNAGHSAALMLTANPNLQLTSVDIGHHSYVTTCSSIIQSYFPNRHKLILKNSSKLDYHELNSDMVVIDGNHSFSGCFLDLALCIAYCKSGTIVVIDDWDAPSVRLAFERVSSSFVPYTEIENTELQGVFYLV